MAEYFAVTETPVFFSFASDVKFPEMLHKVIAI